MLLEKPVVSVPLSLPEAAGVRKSPEEGSLMAVSSEGLVYLPNTFISGWLGCYLLDKALACSVELSVRW